MARIYSKSMWQWSPKSGKFTGIMGIRQIAAKMHAKPDTQTWVPTFSAVLYWTKKQDVNLNTWDWQYQNSMNVKRKRNAVRTQKLVESTASSEKCSLRLIGITHNLVTASSSSIPCAQRYSVYFSVWRNDSRRRISTSEESTRFADTFSNLWIWCISSLTWPGLMVCRIWDRETS